MIMKLRIHSAKVRLCLWFPLILIWLILLALFVLLLPLIAILWIIAGVLWGFWLPPLRIGAAFLELLSALRETEIHVSRRDSNEAFDISML
jgi:hypothetical protein